MYNGLISRADPTYQEVLLKKTAECLRRREKVWAIELELVESRTPIITVVHRDTGLKCDLSFTHGLSVENTKLIGYVAIFFTFY